MPFHGPYREEQQHHVKDQLRELTRLESLGCLCPKSGGKYNLLDRWIENALPHISTTPQSTVNGTMPANNPQRVP